MPEQNKSEKVFYNALSLALESNYRQLKKLKEQNGTWEKSWKNYANSNQTNLDPEKEFEKLAQKNIHLLLLEDSDFPSLLKEIPWPPYGIYILGSKTISNEKHISLVGTRKATLAGRETARSFAKKLAESGFVIVSGLALGIDTESHKGALDERKPTIAVIATGLDSIYPKINTELAKEILKQKGAIISEYPLGSPALPHRFLERNRLVSGLSNGILIIEAPERSGSLATARFALDQNREVFVIPGPITHPNFKGSNQLIRQGAALVTSPEEIIEILAPELITKSESQKIPSDVSTEEKIILEVLLKSGKPVNIDKIAELTNLNAKIINQGLSFLIIKNLIKETENGYTI